MSLMLQRPHMCCISCLERWCYLSVLKVLFKLWLIMLQIMLLLWGCWSKNFVRFIGLFVWCLNFVTKNNESRWSKWNCTSCCKKIRNMFITTVMHYIRRNTGGREILWLAPTCFAANFIALRRILAQKDALRAMVTFRVDNFSIYYRK